jgi:broad specificity phosphatase PhoE
MTSRIHLVRHGTTELNVQQRYRGRLEVALDEQGWADAHAAAAALRETGLTAVYTSPLRRARDTAITIAEAAGIEDVVDAPDLTNLDYGLWEARTKQEAAQIDAEAFARYLEFAEGSYCPGGEQLDAAADRMVAALLEIGRRHPGEQVAAISHAAMVRLALVRTTGRPREDWRQALPNGSITVFDVDGDRLLVPESASEK